MNLVDGDCELVFGSDQFVFWYGNEFVRRHHERRAVFALVV